MATLDPSTAAAEQAKVVDALAVARQLVAGLDDAKAALERQQQTAYSPLRTMLEQGLLRGERVLEYLQAQ